MNPGDYINKISKTSDFNEKIKIRLEFKEKFPEEFEKYMKEIPAQKQRPPLCFACNHLIKGDCELNLWPIGNVFLDIVNYTCSSFKKR